MPNETAFEVLGPMAVQVSLPAAIATFVNLGYTPNNERPTFDLDRHYEELGSTEFGDEPEQIIHTGARGLLQFSLSKWADDTFDSLWAVCTPTGTAEGARWHAGEIGSLYVGGASTTSFMFGVKFTPPGTPTAQRPAIIFPSCMMLGPGSVRNFEFGNTGTRLAFSLLVRRSAVIPAGANAGVYAGISPARTHDFAYLVTSA